MAFHREMIFKKEKKKKNSKLLGKWNGMKTEDEITSAAAAAAVSENQANDCLESRSLTSAILLRKFPLGRRREGHYRGRAAIA